MIVSAASARYTRDNARVCAKHASVGWRRSRRWRVSSASVSRTFRPSWSTVAHAERFFAGCECYSVDIGGQILVESDATPTVCSRGGGLLRPGLKERGISSGMNTGCWLFRAGLLILASQGATGCSRTEPSLIPPIDFARIYQPTEIASSGAVVAASPSFTAESYEPLSIARESRSESSNQRQSNRSQSDNQAERSGLPIATVGNDVAEDDLAPQAPVRAWKYIVLHHSATTDGDVRSIDGDHRGRTDSTGEPWLGIGYHFVIGNGGAMGDGAVEATFRWRDQLAGAHAGSRVYNDTGIGICLIGDFQNSPPTPRQIVAVRELVAALVAQYGIQPANCIRHSDIHSTECPGRFFPYHQIVPTN